MRAVVQRVSRARVTVDVTVNATVDATVDPTIYASGNAGEEGEVTGEIGRGLLVLLGVGAGDTRAAADYLADKIVGLRIFEDPDGQLETNQVETNHVETNRVETNRVETKKMNLSVAEVGGAVLVVSQFTLYGDVRRGRRPSFEAAAPAQQARELYEYFVERIRAAGLHCETGRFQETMQVELVNEGPVTILLDSAKAF